jgi:hypothetical protein
LLDIGNFMEKLWAVILCLHVLLRYLGGSYSGLHVDSAEGREETDFGARDCSHARLCPGHMAHYISRRKHYGRDPIDLATEHMRQT